MAVSRTSFLSFLLCWFTAGVGFAQAPASSETVFLKVYQTVEPDRSLQTSPQFLVIDDFNDGKMTNLRGALWRTKTPVPGALDLSLTKVDARNPERGYSLNANIHLQKNEIASFRSFLNRLDVSAAAYFVFQCQIKIKQENFPGKLRVRLTDWKQQSVTHDVTDACPVSEKEWGEVIMPMEMFSGIDHDQLSLVEYEVAAEEKIRGEIRIDEAAFFGFNDVAFESHRDNLVGYPKIVYDEGRREKLLKEKNKHKLLRKIGQDTWKYFENARDKETFLLVDHIRMGDGPLAADYTSPTNIAMDVLSTISALELKFISKKEAKKRIEKTLTTLENMRRFDGFFYNFYDTKKLFVTRSYISSVDSGWLAAALVVTRQVFPDEFYDRATEILDSFSFGEFLDEENNQLIIGFDVPRREVTRHHYGMLATEARLTSYYAIGKGDVPEKHWWFLYRTLPGTWDWQRQEPKGEMVIRDGIDYFQGYYEYQDQKFVPSWGGSLFEFLAPTLLMNEKKLAKKGLGLNNRITTELQREYSMEKDYPVWGMAPAAVGSGRLWTYEEFGVPALGAKGYRDREVVTPYAGILALDSLPEEAIENIRNLLKFEHIYGEYGFYDSLNLRNSRVNPQYLALDQGMILVAICNYLKKDAIKRYFHADPIGKKPEHLLKEEFF